MKPWYLGLMLGLSAPLWAANPDVNELLQQVRNRPDGSDIYSDLKLVMTDGQGGQRERDLYYLQKDQGADEKLTLYFLNPSEVKGVGFQSITYSEAAHKDDDQWLYLPAFRQVRRIAANDKRGSFMGSEYAYIDMEKLRVTDYQQQFIGETTLDGRPCWIVERTPINDEVIGRTGYYKTVLWIDKDRKLVLKQTYYDARGLMFKQMTVKRVEQVQNIWTVMHSDMEDLTNQKVSSLIFSNVRYDVGLQDNLFQQSILKSGVRSGNLPSFN